MDLVAFFQAFVLGIVEGLTEFLPVSSTGHLILTAQLLGLQGASLKTTEIAIQSGAIFAVLLHYRATVFGAFKGLLFDKNDHAAQHLALLVIIGCLPAIVIGLLFGKAIQAALFTPLVVAATFMVGGLIILWAERRSPQALPYTAATDLSLRDALKVGLVQCLALIPGTSRSGATIVGGMLFGLPRKVATEYSFFLAIPLLLGASAYSLYKNRADFAAEQLQFLGVGTVAAFFSAWLCIRWLLKFVSNHSFVGFAYYRIAFGALILLTHTAGWVKWA